MINKHCWLLTLLVSDKPPEMVIGHGCAIGHFNHISCVDRVYIEEKVLTADGVFIADHGHHYEDPTMPIVDQGVVSRGPVVIGRGSWLGENVAVISCKIGRNCVIGANSVVLDDIPDYSVAVGAPARVVRRFNPRNNSWERTSNGCTSDSYRNSKTRV
jgi:acetyltransferase-like isoleucine patch superfamily enzyme